MRATEGRLGKDALSNPQGLALFEKAGLRAIEGQLVSFFLMQQFRAQLLTPVPLPPRLWATSVTLFILTCSQVFLPYAEKPSKKSIPQKRGHPKFSLAATVARQPDIPLLLRAVK